MHAIDVLIVQKQSILARFEAEHGPSQALELLARGGHDVPALLAAHRLHSDARSTILEVLRARGLSYELVNLDELARLNANYFQCSDLSSGLRPRAGLVVSLGGDGTLLHASHYVGGVFRLIGVNSAPGRSQGFLCAALPDTFAQTLDRSLCDSDYFEVVPRLCVSLSSGEVLPLALNDVLLCHSHPAATSRYLIGVLHPGEDCSPSDMEIHKSSGVWIASPAGSTAAVRSHGFSALDVTENRFILAVRELYNPWEVPHKVVGAILEGGDHCVRLVSRMQSGLVCVDGHDFSASFGFACVATVSLPRAAALRLIIGSHRNRKGVEDE